MNPSEYRTSLQSACGSADEFRWRQAELIRAAHDEYDDGKGNKDLARWVEMAGEIIKRSDTTVRAYQRAAEFRHRMGARPAKLSLEYYVITSSYLDRADFEELCDRLADAAKYKTKYEPYRDFLSTTYGAPPPSYGRLFQSMADKLWARYDAAPEACQPHIEAAVAELKQAKEKAGK